MTSVQYTVLIVDDDSDIRESLSEVLCDEGFVTFTANNGSDALQWLERNVVSPAVILLDIMMPVMDGWGFLERRKAHPTLCAIPVVILSANASVPPDANWGGVVAYLRKPVDLDPLVSTVRKLASAG